MLEEVFIVREEEEGEGEEEERNCQEGFGCKRRSQLFPRDMII